jgi:guanosine-3',5'-bis(diphosphate) 3'-pyrophosphohydrolase
MADRDSPERRLLEAISFATRAHQGQVRKDGKTPYASHPFRVAMIIRHLFGIDNPAVLTAAVLHDTIEDTTTDFDDLAEQFGTEVAGWATQLTKDKRLAEPERERAYKAVLAAAPWQVKVCKLADIYDNLLDTHQLKDERRLRTYQRSRDYLAVLDDPALPPDVRRAYQTTARLLEQIASK